MDETDLVDKATAWDAVAEKSAKLAKLREAVLDAEADSVDSEDGSCVMVETSAFDALVSLAKARP